jgi:hypothetical protein
MGDPEKPGKGRGKGKGKGTDLTMRVERWILRPEIQLSKARAKGVCHEQ